MTTDNKWEAMDRKPDTPKVGVGVMIFKDNKLLLMRRKGSHGAGEWSLPGGHMELGESFLDTCKREVMEEIGIDIYGVKNVDFESNIFHQEGLHYVTLFFEADWDSSQDIVNMEPDKADAIEWFAPDNLPRVLFGALRRVLEKSEWLKHNT